MRLGSDASTPSGAEVQIGLSGQDLPFSVRSPSVVDELSDSANGGRSTEVTKPAPTRREGREGLGVQTVPDLRSSGPRCRSHGEPGSSLARPGA
jgi:hypothetical protein